MEGMTSLYRPRIQQGYDMITQLINAHAEDLAEAHLNWKEYQLKDSAGVVIAVQLLPWVRARFKGAY